MKSGARAVVERRPDVATVILDDGTADRESHAHACRLGRVEGIKDFLYALFIQTNARVPDFNSHLATFVVLRLDDQLAGSAFDRTHGVDAVHNKVE